MNFGGKRQSATGEARRGMALIKRKSSPRRRGGAEKSGKDPVIARDRVIR
jgi:hypothetical protein